MGTSITPTIAWSFLFIYGGLAVLYLIQIIILSKIHKASTVGQVSQNNCGIDAIEQDTYRYQLAEALEGYAPGYKGLGTVVTVHNLISWAVLVYITSSLIRTKIMHGADTGTSDLQVFVGLSAIFMPFYIGYFWIYAPQVESDEVKTYRSHVRAVTDVLDALKKAKLLDQETIQTANAAATNDAQKSLFNLNLYLLQLRVIERIMTVDQMRSRTDAADAFRNMNGVDIVRYINFDMDKDYPHLASLMDLRDGSNKALTESFANANCQTSKASSALFILTGCDGAAPSSPEKFATISFDQAKAYRNALEALKSTDFKTLAKAQSNGYTTWVKFLYFTGIFFGCAAIHFLLKVVSMVKIVVGAVFAMSVFVAYYMNFG